MTADDLHAAIDEMDTRGLTGVVWITFHEPDRMNVGASVEDAGIVIQALEQALDALQKRQHGRMN